MFRTKVVEEMKRRFVLSYFFPPENRAVYEIMCKNIVEQGRPHENTAHSHCMLDN